MMSFLLIIAGTFLALHLYRQYWTHRNLPQVSSGEFNGEMFRVGETFIARRAASDGSNKTIVCFPGFLEDMRYFQTLYEDVHCELILVNNANYHCPFPDLPVQPLEWPANPYLRGTIEHDGFYLAHTLQELAGGAECILHGHSRGGAVVLEAGRQFPQLMQRDDVSVSGILEAPVLPGARSVGKANEPMTHRIICYLMPIALGLARSASVKQLLKQPMMRPTNDLKTRTVKTIYSTARNYSTCVENVRSIVTWQRETAYDIYSHYPNITIIMGERDDVLDNPSMLASAEQGSRINSSLSIVKTTDTNHFVSLEQPHYLFTAIGL